ncbi:MAG: hypothetical protein J5518_01045 [Lachnospiraceae bacterium]|nr:hypothetical protein [Lachnospiraceae bacterium]
MGKKVLKILLVILAVLGVLFLILMLLPDEEEEPDREETGPVAEHVTETQDKQMSQALTTSLDVETMSMDTGARSATVMVYMNGSDLESQDGQASRDIAEMIASGVGENVNVIIQTMGTKEWQEYGISSKTAQTYRVRNHDLELLRDDLGQLDCTEADTLSEFIGFCKTGFPAERYLFLFWDHGGGPVYGFGYDEWQSDESSLTIAEMARAFSAHPDITFDIIGMDCCIMANLETCYALAPFCRFTLLSEDFESGIGWNYTEWMKYFEAYPGASTPLLGKKIIDAVIEENESSSEGDSACVALFNESTVSDLFAAWKTYAYKHEDELLGKNYSRVHKARGRLTGGFWDMWDTDESDVTLSDYYISDILALLEGIDKNSDEAKKLMSTLKACVAYYGHTSDKNELTGLAVSLPYGDAEFYDTLRSVYKEAGFDQEYIDWLRAFVSRDQDDYYDYDTFENDWGGWGTYEKEYGCNISGGGSCEYGYDYDFGDGPASDDWIYDYEEEIWYLYDDDMLYLYDEESNLVFYYDEDEDEIYYYDEDDDDWYVYKE